MGDKPSEKNIDPDIAFVGANSFNRLVEWINYLKPDYYICLNSENANDIFKIARLVEDGFKVIALGNNSAKRLEHYGYTFFKLPHPSGLNRQINDRKAIEHALDSCLVWLRDEPVSGAV